MLDRFGLIFFSIHSGGEKFFANGIFVKYAVDNNRVFGGSDARAMKAAALEKKGLQAIMAIGLGEGLSFPLLTVVDYAGFRMSAVSLLPIDAETLCLGSGIEFSILLKRVCFARELFSFFLRKLTTQYFKKADGGKTIHRDNENLVCWNLYKRSIETSI